MILDRARGGAAGMLALPAIRGFARAARLAFRHLALAQRLRHQFIREHESRFRHVGDPQRDLDRLGGVTVQSEARGFA
jgi:hypothetical protein